MSDDGQGRTDRLRPDGGDDADTPFDGCGAIEAVPDGGTATDPFPDGGSDPDVLLAELFAVIEDRKATLPDDSHTADLLRGGEAAAAEKVGEEAAELVVAATSADDDAVAHEAADVVYHLLVLLAARDLTLDDLRSELAERRG